jgi:hypothetical protein
MFFWLLWIAWIVDGRHVHVIHDPRCPAFAPRCVMRTFYIAAEEVDWDYAPSGMYVLRLIFIG